MILFTHLATTHSLKPDRTQNHRKYMLYNLTIVTTTVLWPWNNVEVVKNGINRYESAKLSEYYHHAKLGINPFTAMLSRLSLEKRPIKVPNFKPLKLSPSTHEQVKEILSKCTVLKLDLLYTVCKRVCEHFFSLVPSWGIYITVSEKIKTLMISKRSATQQATIRPAYQWSLYI